MEPTKDTRGYKRGAPVQCKGERGQKRVKFEVVPSTSYAAYGNGNSQMPDEGIVEKMEVEDANVMSLARNVGSLSLGNAQPGANQASSAMSAAQMPQQQKMNAIQIYNLPQYLPTLSNVDEENNFVQGAYKPDN